MPETLQAFIWIFGLGIIGLLLAIVGFLIKDKLDRNTQEMINFRTEVMDELKSFKESVIELFREDKAKVKAIEELKGDIKAINERCKLKCEGD